jgi:predicted DNA-binding protein YlxM (UPF0122 family)
MIEKKMEIGNLYDFYGQLLTDNQKQMIELYIYEDLSLGEIGENLNVSRQAIYDSIKRSQKTLQNYEEKLKLIYKFEIHKKELKEIGNDIKEIQNSMDDKKLNGIFVDIINRMNRLMD